MTGLYPGDVIDFISTIDFELSDVQGLRAWLQGVVVAEARELGDLTYIFCSDAYLLEMNRSHLNHDFYTDVITFDYTEGKRLCADIFISIDRVRENAETYSVEFSEELQRVMIHGLLHLAGYDDQSEGDKQRMRSREDFHIARLGRDCST